MKCPNSLREYIRQLNEIGEIQEINQEIDWNLEIGAIMRFANNKKSPALLFNKIKGYKKGFRVLGSPVSASKQKNRFHSRVACSLGLPPDTPASKLITELSKIPKVNPIQPTVIPSAHARKIYLSEIMLTY